MNLYIVRDSSYTFLEYIFLILSPISHFFAFFDIIRYSCCFNSLLALYLHAHQTCRIAAFHGSSHLNCNSTVKLDLKM